MNSTPHSCLRLSVILLLFSNTLGIFDLCPREDEVDYPLSYYNNYQCESHVNCRFGYRCCPHRLFGHKICLQQLFTFNKCPPMIFDCASMASKKLDFCFSNRDCSEGLVCCPDFCSFLNICKRRNEGPIFDESFHGLEKDTRLLYCPRESCELDRDPRYLCEGDGDCAKGFRCYHHCCFVHKVCLKLDESFGFGKCSTVSNGADAAEVNSGSGSGIGEYDYISSGYEGASGESGGILEEGSTYTLSGSGEERIIYTFEDSEIENSIERYGDEITDRIIVETKIDNDDYKEEYIGDYLYI